jgi:N-terminal domain of anti-restriction factor ArdC
MKAADLTQRIKQFVDELAAETDAVRASAMFQNYIEAMSRFHRYSWSNQLLILMQNPAAQHVAGYNTWLKMHRQVRKGEKGIAILAPVVVRVDAEDGQATRRLVNFRAEYVFDVSQTNGEPLPVQPDWKSTERRAELHERLVVFAEHEGISVTTGTLPADARGASMGGKIVLIPEASTKTLLHEIAHELLHRSGGADDVPSQQAREIEAETTAYVVCRHFGLGDSKSPNYLALWGADAAAIHGRLGRIQKAVSKIILAVDGQKFDNDGGGPTEVNESVSELSPG